MAVFAYIAIEQSGKKHRGEVDAASQQDAMVTLRERGSIVLKLTPRQESVWKRDIGLGPPVKLRAFTAFCRQFATMVEAGVTLFDTLASLEQQAETPAFKRILSDIRRDLTEGEALSAALSRHPKVFSPLFVSLVKAGELSGRLPEVLRRLAEYQEKMYQTRGKVKSALTYPVVVSVLAVVVAVFLLSSIVPTFARMFTSMNAPLPLPTRVVLALSNTLTHQWYAYAAAAVLLLAGGWWMKRNARAKELVDRLILHLPIFGSLVLKSAVARMTRTLATLLESAVGLVRALEMTAETVNNTVVASALLRAGESVERGEALSHPLKGARVFPAMVVQMIQVGEKTGTIDNMLHRIADFYESEVEVAVEQIKGTVEPLLVLVLAVIVGTIVSAIILPMFTIMNYVH